MDRLPLNASKRQRGRRLHLLLGVLHSGLGVGTPVGAESGKEAVLISKEVDGGPPVRLSDLDRHCLKF